MKTYYEQKFSGERALFKAEHLGIEACTFGDGESHLKESNNININNSSFRWKYPLWYATHITINDSVLFEMARAGIWYTNNISVHHTIIEAPKSFRRSQKIKLSHVNFINAEETLWHCKDIVMKQVTAKGDYFAMNSSHMTIEDFTLVGNYSFDGVRDVTIKNARLISKDAFWNAENVTVYDSYISGQYLGWNAKNITFINCVIESEQGMCYMENLVMKDCKVINTDLAFEYATVDVEVEGHIESVKNPYSGKIRAKSIGEVIFDDQDIHASNVNIEIIDKQVDIA